MFIKPVVLVTGAGTLATALAFRLVDDGYKVRTLSRGEHLRGKLKQAITKEPYLSNISILAGDVCDSERLSIAMRGVDVVIHAAALKRIDDCERDPIEAVRVNVLGTQNVIHAAVKEGVRKALLISTDKACSPSTLYGATKLCAERMWLSAQAYAGGKQPYFMALRYGNVFGSAGSVIHAFKAQEHTKRLTITDWKATRFHITLDRAVGLVRYVMEHGRPGELHIPKLPSYRLEDLATAFMAGNRRQWEMPTCCGLRPAEKLHESLISPDESESIVADTDKGYVLEPGRYPSPSPGKRFAYSSQDGLFLSVDELQELIREYA